MSFYNFLKANDIYDLSHNIPTNYLIPKWSMLVKDHELKYLDQNKIIELLLSRPFSLNRIPFQEIIFEASRRRYWDVVKVLLKLGVSPNPEYYESVKYIRRPIYLAVEDNNLPMVKILLEYGLYDRMRLFEATKPTLVGLAIKNKNFSMIDLLIQYGAQSDGNDLKELISLD